MDNPKPEATRSDGEELHDELFNDGEGKVKDAEQNITKPLKQLVSEAQAMIDKGETFKILIPQGGRVDVAGVPFTASKISKS